MNSTTVEKTIEHNRTLIAHHGVPEQLVSDNPNSPAKSSRTSCNATASSISARHLTTPPPMALPNSLSRLSSQPCKPAMPICLSVLDCRTFSLLTATHRMPQRRHRWYSSSSNALSVHVSISSILPLALSSSNSSAPKLAIPCSNQLVITHPILQSTRGRRRRSRKVNKS